MNNKQRNKVRGDLEKKKEFYFQYFVMKVLNVLESWKNFSVNITKFCN